MIRDLLKWVAPALLTVLGGTTAALSMATPSMTGQLHDQGQARAEAYGLGWTEVEFNGRDLFITAATETPRARETVLAMLANVPGVGNIPLKQFPSLESGEASIVDGVSRLRGVPPSVDVAQAVTNALLGNGSIVELAPPNVGDYWVSITRQAGGTLVFDGYAPDGATVAALGEIDGADVNYLKLGGGAPANYRAAVDFGVKVLSHLSEGRVALNRDTVTISGMAKSPVDYEALEALVDQGLPQGLTMGAADYLPPPAANYQFALVRGDDGSVVLAGMLPNRGFEGRLLAKAGAAAASTVTFSSGEPDNFATAADQATQFLPWLARGEIRFDGAGWTVSGTPGSALDKASIETEFAVQRLAQSGWALKLADPEQTQPAVTPYVWSGERLADGSFLFAGNVPDIALKDYLAEHIDSRVADTSAVSPGAPEDFSAQVRAAADALLALEEGRAAFDGERWSLGGRAADEGKRAASLAIAATSLGLNAADTIEAPAAAPYLWAAAKSVDGTLVFTGNVPAEALQRFIAVRAGSEAVDETTIREDAPDSFSADVMRALELLPLIEEGEVSFDGANWTIAGTGTNPDANDQARLVLGENSGWQVAIRTVAREVEPVEPVAETVAIEPTPDPEPVVEPTAPVDTATLAQCTAEVAELSSHNAILFQSGAAIIAAGASAELDAFATALARCPDTSIYVEGHTDSDGDTQKNLALSVARAEAVVMALIERGVAAERLYAVGYGETQPVADNSSADGKRQNRRIVVTLGDGDN